MRILEIYVSAFGGLRDLRMEWTAGINAVSRPNGWGKTTLVAFLRAMLYGLSHVKGTSAEEDGRKKYAPWQGGAFGGSMSFETARGRFRAERFFGAKEREDTFVLYDLSTNLVSDAYSCRLGEELFGIDAEGFARTVLLTGERTTSRTADAGLSARLAALVEAADDVGDYDAAREALEKRSRYYLTTGSRGRIPALERETVALERRREELLRESESLAGKRREAEALAKRLSALEEETRRVRNGLRDAARDAERAALQAQRRALEARVTRIRVRLRAQDEASGGKHPSEEAIRRARERAEEVRRLALSQPTPPARRFSTAMLVAAILLVGLALVLTPVLLFAGGGSLWWLGLLLLPPAAVLGILCLRARAADRAAMRTHGERVRALERERRNARTALSSALVAVGLDAESDGTGLEEVARRQVEYRLLREELREARDALTAFDAAHGALARTSSASCADPQTLAEREAALEEETRTARASLAATEAAIERLSVSTEELASTETALVECRAALEEAREAHATLCATERLLREAKESLSTRYLEQMEERMQAYLETLSADAPTVVADARLSLSVKTDTGTHALSRMSSGWQDLIGLCARLSLADVLFADTETPPLILDDPFVYLDEEHLHAGKRLLTRLSETYQILYAVCHTERG